MGAPAQRGMALLCEQLTAQCLSQLARLVSHRMGHGQIQETHALREDVTNLYLWQEGFDDGKLHDVAIFSKDLGINILTTLTSVAGCLIRCEYIGIPQKCDSHPS